MAKKIFVIDSAAGLKTPFLRGVLVQSLVGTGLSFQDAYEVAQKIRGLLDDAPDTTTVDLRVLVAGEIERRFGAEARTAYETGNEQDRGVMVISPERAERFSVGILTRHLEGCGIRQERAAVGARAVQEILLKRGDTQIDRLQLRRIIYETLKETNRAWGADRFLSRCRLRDSGTPLIVLLGGATGTGKSTIAAALAYLLEIVRTQSTDMMREIIRCYLVPHVAPTLGYSSFDAWQGLPAIEPLLGQSTADNTTIAGFLSQFGTVKVALEATIARAVKERHDLIVDGVHVLPTRLNLAKASESAVVVSAVLAVPTIERLDRRLLRRGGEQPERAAARHREAIAAIWELQGFMVDQAERAQIPVIANWSVEETVEQVMNKVMERIGERFPPDVSALSP